MADNVTSNSGAGGGAVFATDDIGGVHYPITKITIGALDASTLLTGGSGTVDAGCPRVTLATNDAAVTALQLIDNAVSGAGFNITQFGGASVPIGAGLEATAVRVTLPTDGTGKVNAAQSGTWNIGTLTSISNVVQVADNAGSLTVDGTVAATQSGTWDIGTVTSISQLGGQAIAMGTGVRTAGTQRVTVATDDVVPASQSGTWNITNISGTVSLPTGAATAALQTTLNGHVDGIEALLTTIDADTSALAALIDAAPTDAEANAGSRLHVEGFTYAFNGTSWDRARTVGDLPSTGTGVLAAAAVGQRDDAATGTLTEGQYGTIRSTEYRAQHVNLRDASGNEISSGGVVGNGAAATAQRVTIANDSTGVLGTVTTVTTVGTVTTLTGGGIAHDAADSGNPIKIGAKAETSPKGITLVADGDRTDLYADSDGMQMVKLNTSGADVISEAVSNTDGNSTAFTNFSAVANTKNYITAYHCFRTDSGTTPIYIDFRDGTGGSVLWRVVLPAGGGANSPACAGPALFKTAANTALAFDVSAATTTVYINVSGYQSKV